MKIPQIDPQFAGCFIKFAELEHLVILQQTGLLYCNPVSEFAKIEDEDLRGDKLEDVLEMMYMESGEVALAPVGEKPNENSVKMPFRDLQMTGRAIEPFGNLFCMTAINVLDKSFGEVFTIDERVRKFGTHFLFIHDTRSFMSRLKKVLGEMKLGFRAGLVEYIDFSKFSGKKSVFQKHAIFSYQKEWRLFIENKKDEVLQIKIGSIEDISLLGSSANIKDLQIAAREKPDKVITILSNLQRMERI